MLASDHAKITDQAIVLENSSNKMSIHSSTLGCSIMTAKCHAEIQADTGQRDVRVSIYILPAFFACRFTPVRPVRKMHKANPRSPKDDAHDPEHSETAIQLRGKVAELKSSVSSEAQRIIHEVMPKKVGTILFCSIVKTDLLSTDS